MASVAGKKYEAVLSWANDKFWGLRLSREGKPDLEVNWDLAAENLFGNKQLEPEIGRPLVQKLLERATGFGPLREDQLAFIRGLVSSLAREEWVSGRRLRQQIKVNDIDYFRRWVASLAPRYVRIEDAEHGDFYSPTLPGLFIAQDEAAGKMMALILGAIRRRYEIDPDARYYDWDDLSAVGIERDSVKLAYHVASIAQLMWGGSMGDSGDRPNIRLGMPQDVERLLVNLSSMTFEQHIVHEANSLPEGTSRHAERPWMTAPLWLDDDGPQSGPATRGASTISPSSHPTDGSLDESKKAGETAMPDPRKVFVVYGRDDKQKDFFFDFLRRLQLNPIEFEEAIRLTGSGSPYIGDAVSTALKHAQVVLVLFTGDDLAHLRPELVRDSDGEFEKRPSPQPRPNVILEAGMALALDRNRTIIVEIPPLRGISDLHGVHVVRFGKGEATERNNLANRLETAGCDVKRIGNDWLSLPFPSKPPGL